MTKKYGNDKVWVYFSDEESPNEYIIWNNVGETPMKLAVCYSKYDAKLIVNGIIDYLNNNKSQSQFSKQQTVFCEFISSNCKEPWATMARNAVLWNDVEIYNNLKNRFSEIYEL